MRTLLRCTAVAMLILLTGCATNDDTTTSSMSDAEMLTIGKQLAQCYRDNGMPDMPDPYVEEGHVKLPDAEADKVEEKYSQQQFDQAEQACQDIAAKLPEGALQNNDEKQQSQKAGPEDVEALRKFAQCIRENGVPEWPDPNADGSFPLKGSPLIQKDDDSDGPPQRIADATEKCRQYWSGGVSIS